MLTSVVTGFLMWWNRRPRGGTGLPGPANAVTRAETPKRAVIAVSAVAVVLGVLFPVFGVSLLVVLAVEAVLALRRRANGDGGDPPAPVADLVIDEDGDDVPVGALR